MTRRGFTGVPILSHTALIRPILAGEQLTIQAVVCGLGSREFNDSPSGAIRPVGVEIWEFARHVQNSLCRGIHDAPASAIKC